MKIIVFDNKIKKIRLNKFIDWLIYMVLYTLILITVSTIFKNTVYIDNSYFGLWAFLASVLIYILNKTVKPILIFLTLPITGITLGLFYPFINVIILKIVSFILNDHFNINGIFFAFLVAVLISIMNILMEVLVLNPLLSRGE
ncbi:MAG TPA: phage holin family protein [Tenericutes bacterium]|nr:phage holin family protein [Mycoplasmatota bacterium]